MVNRVVTGAHYGLRDWMIQRISAVMMVAYTVFIVGWLLTHEFNYDNWKQLFAGTAMRSLSLLLLLAVFYHAWIGVRDIVMDYIKPPIVRLLIHVLVILALLLYVIWAVQILWSV
jgi:succinate dehydrogenase / fumarate reductase membrane anchor subunit